MYIHQPNLIGQLFQSKLRIIFLPHFSAQIVNQKPGKGVYMPQDYQVAKKQDTVVTLLLKLGYYV